MPPNDSLDATALPVQLYIVTTEKHSKPCVELRRATTDTEYIKLILRAAFNNQVILVAPTFRDRLRSLNTLVEKGIIVEEKGQYNFTI